MHKTIERSLVGATLFLTLAFVFGLTYTPKSEGQGTGWAPVNGPFSGAVAATTLSASSTVSGTGFSTYLASPPAIGGTAAAAGTFTILSANGAAAASAPGVNLTGTLFTGGSATTTVPYLYINQGGSVSTWATNGTILGFNTPASCGNALDFHLNGGGSFYSVSCGGGVKANSYNIGANVLLSGTAPTISSGFGTGASVTANNGTAAFRINVGTGGAATSGVIGLPTAATGWNCYPNDITTTSATVYLTKQTASSTTTATIGNFTTAGAAGAWTASDVLAVSCFAF